MHYRPLLLSMVLVYASTVGSIFHRARPVAAASRVVTNGYAGTQGFALMRAAIGQAKPQSPAVELPEGKGKELAKKQCGTCHANNVWTNQHHTRDQWSAVIDNMISKGMHASDDDLDTITDYLATNFGPVTATPPAGPTSATPPASR